MNYQEVQRFGRLVWVWFVILPIAGFVWYSAYQQLLVGQSVGARPMSNLILVIFWLAFGILMPLLFFTGGMRTEVGDSGIDLLCLPLPLYGQHIAYSEIDTYEVRQYRPLLDYGGWGIRFGRGGKAYTVSGRQGVKLVFKNGQRLLIGSQRPDQLVAAIDRRMKPA